MILHYSSHKKFLKHTKETKDIMKHSIKLIFTTSLCITSIVSVAMELELPKEKQNKEKTAKILRAITCIKEPHSASYLTENTFLASGKQQCCIVDSTTNKTIKEIFKRTIGSLPIAVHPNKTKFALAAYHRPPNITHENNIECPQQITIYNAQTYEIEHTIEWDLDSYIAFMRFSPLNDTLAICEGAHFDVSMYNYKTNTNSIIHIPEAATEYIGRNMPLISFHPTQALICLAWNTVYIHDLEKPTTKTMAIAHSLHPYTWCEYSPDGSRFATVTRNDKINIIKPAPMPYWELEKEQYESYHYIDNPDTIGMTMHPHGKVLMVLLKPNFHRSQGFYTLEYWDINTFEHITTQLLSAHVLNRQIPCFSPSGSKLLILKDNAYFELKVPFKVLYKDIRKKTLLYLLFALKNYAHDGTTIPHELTQLIAKTVHETYKR
jgi:WD40 repeat protein